MSNSTSLLVHRIIKGFADATIKVFIPLLIYKATGDLFLTFLFAFLTYIFESLSYMIFKKVIQKHGVLAIILHIIPESEDRNGHHGIDDHKVSIEACGDP